MSDRISGTGVNFDQNLFNQNNQINNDNNEVNNQNNQINNDNNEVNNQNNVVQGNAVDDGLKDQEINGFVVVSNRQFLSTSSKNLANAFVNMLKGNTVPSEIQIKNEKDQVDSNLQKQLANAAVKVATAMITSIGSTKTIHLGFQVGDFTLELTRDASGKYKVEVEGLSQEGKVESFDVNIEDIDAKFAARITYDILKNNENDLYDKGLAGKGGRLSALDQILVASDESGKSPLSRKAFAEILHTRKNIDFADMDKVGTGVLRHLAAQTALDRQISEEDIKAKLKESQSAPPIMVNSAEAAKDMQMITDLLSKEPNKVTSKVNIDNIGHVRTDPQQGMNETQKVIHTFIADLFMPSNTAIYDNNDGQVGNRIRQVLLQNINAVKILAEEALKTGELPINTMPDQVKNHLGPQLERVIFELTNSYFGSLSPEEKEAYNQNLQQPNLDLNKLRNAIVNTPVQQFAKIDATVNETAELMAKEQQQILTEKFNVSLQNNEALKAENAGSKPFYEVNIKQIYDKHVKTVVNEELKNTNPKEYEKQVEQRGKENVQALKEIYSVYKKPMLALLTIDEKMEDADFDSPLGQFNQSVRTEYPAFNHFRSVFKMLFNLNPNLPDRMDNWSSEEGSEVYDKLLESMDNEKTINMMNMSETWLAPIVKIKEGEDKCELQKAMIKFSSDEVLKSMNLDLKSKTLTEMANEPDDFNKPGMGQLIKNVLNSYFSSEETNGTELGKVRQTDKRSMIGAMIRYSDRNASKSAQLGAMLKGAGPLMHKLLQGLDIPGMDQELKTALEDMKSNLSPIDPVYVQAQMLKLVNDSKGTISNLSIEKPLGAASVGQAFLVKVTPSKGEPYTAVLKIIRPEVKVKTEREFAEFMREAEKIPGMKETYAGIYEQYKREFDLKLEAANIALGQQAYNDNIDKDRVNTMSLVDNVPVSETSMLIKQAEGTTLDSYLADIKNKITALKSRPYKTHEDVLNIKRELLGLYKELKDVNTSLNLTAKKWFNKVLFNKKGFFHGDMHAGNLMVKPADLSVTDPQDPKGKTLITIIDYGNASQLDETQTEGVLKVNIAASFGGLYQFNADETQKPYVEKQTVRIFMEGFKSLLSPEEKQKFEAREEDLKERIIKPILLKGSKAEVGIRMNLLIKKLQEEGVAIPGAIANMSQSESRLGNGFDEINSLMNSISDAMENIKLTNTASGMDPAGGMIYDSYSGTALSKYRITALEKELNYDLNNTAPLDNWKKQQQIAIPQGADLDTIKSINSAKAEAEAKMKEYKSAQESQMRVLRGIFNCFNHDEDDVWTNRQIVAEDVTDEKTRTKISETFFGNYLKSDKNSDEIYPLHKEFLALRENVSKEDQAALDDALHGFFERNEQFRDEARDKLDNLLKKPAIKAWFDCGNKIKAIMSNRMIETVRSYNEEFSLSNPAKTDPTLNERKDLTTATIDVVVEQLSGQNEAESLKKAKTFASNSLGIGTGALIFNLDNKRDYVQFIADNIGV